MFLTFLLLFVRIFILRPEHRLNLFNNISAFSIDFSAFYIDFRSCGIKVRSSANKLNWIILF